jgi:ABC-type sugar transport system permease subunit
LIRHAVIVDPVKGYMMKKHYAYNFQNYLFLTPTAILLLVFVFYPFFVGLIYSFSDWNGIFITKWLGFGNYIRLFQDISFQAALRNTLMYGIVVPALVLPLGLFFASVLNARFLRLNGVFRTVIYLPATLSLLIVSNVFNILLVFEGAVDQLWLLLGHEKVLNIMGSVPYMRTAMIIIMVWCSLGGCVVFLLAGLQGISKELFEAAYVDGADSVNVFFRITLPLMRPTIMVVTFITMNGMLKTFDLPYKMTQGGPGMATISIAMLIFRQAFANNTMGYATTTGIVLLIMVSILAYAQMRITGGREDLL